MATYENSQDSTNRFAILMARARPNMLYILMICGALIAFEIFNYSTTDHALRDLLGDLTFAGMPWATVLAIAFCGIDFAGVARLFTPEQGDDEPKEVWYLFGAWILAATMNATLTWWGVSLAVTSHNVQSSMIADQSTIRIIVPIFVAVMVWVIRILIIGMLARALDHAFHQDAPQRAVQSTYSAQQKTASAQAFQGQQQRPAPQPNRSPVMPAQPVNTTQSNYPRPSMARAAAQNQRSPQSFADNDVEHTNSRSARPEPTYHSVGAFNAAPANPRAANNNSVDSSQTGGRFRRS